MAPLLLAALVLETPSARPEGTVQITTRVLRDNRSLAYPEAGGTVVTSPYLSYVGSLDDRTTLRLQTNADAIAAASRRIDAVSAASRLGLSTRAARRAWLPDHGALEVRMQHEGDLRRRVGPAFLSAGGGISYEWDYESRYVKSGFELPMAMKNTTWSLEGSSNWDTYTPDLVGQDSDRQKHWWTLSTGLTQLLSPTALAQVSLYHSEAHGFLSDPYVFFPTPTGYRQETLPDERARTALLFRGVQYLPTHTALHLLVRAYTDTWGIRSESGEVQAFQEVAERVTLRGRWRAYYQSAADFYDPRGAAQALYDTPNRHYAGFIAHMVGLKLIWNLPDRWARALDRSWGTLRFAAKADAYVQSTGFEATIGEGSVEVGF